MPTEHVEEYDTQFVDIGASIYRLTTCHLWSHVFGCTQQHARIGERRNNGAAPIVHHACNTKVGQYQSPIRMEEEITRLDVSMDHAVGMGIIGRRSRPFDIAQGYLQGKDTMFCQYVTHVASGENGHHQVSYPILSSNLIYRSKVREFEP